jgi:chaperonin GroEL (HSP60 family)
MTAMTGKGAEGAKDKLASIVVNAVKQVEVNGKADLKDIKIEKSKGDSVEDTELISGIVIDKEKVSADMPSRVDDAKIALVDFPIELKNPEIDTKISISSPEQLHNFLSEEEKTISKMVDKIKATGANVVFCQKGVDDFAQYLLSKDDIYVVRRIARSDMEKIAKATSGKIVSNINELDAFELGDAKIVEEVRHGEDVMTHIKGCKSPKALTILIHGGSEHIIDEIERAIKDGLGVVASSLKTGLVVPGGGAIEIELSKKLKEFSQGLSGREQLAVEEFANALEFIPITLAENAGMDPIDVLTELKARHDAGEKNAGLNLFTDKVENVLEARILEPYKVKSQAINSASEVAVMILRIDDVIAASGKKGKMTSMTGGMPPMSGDF